MAELSLSALTERALKSDKYTFYIFYTHRWIDEISDGILLELHQQIQVKEEPEKGEF